jgi:hypothetical protein
MATIIPSSLTRYFLTSEEEIVGQCLNTEQKACIQNNIVLAMEQRMALVPDPNNYPEFIQTEAHLKGQIQAYQYLLECSEAAESRMLGIKEDSNFLQQQ